VFDPSGVAPSMPAGAHDSRVIDGFVLPPPDTLSPDSFVAPDGGCPPGFTRCGAVCAKLDTDPKHCGQCDNACPAGTTDGCVASKCACGGGPPCANGLNCVNGTCVCAVGGLCAGCCDPDSTVCVPLGSQSTAKCGKNGAICIGCDDGNPCTADSCLPTGDCSTVPQPDQTPCDDGLFCTSNDQCTAGVCGGAPTSCQSDPCNDGVCSESAKACVKQAKPDGTSCDDGQYCSVNESCTAGVCGGGVPRDCPGDPCNIGVCIEASKVCAKEPQPNGTLCNDGKYCTVNESCTAGVCGGGVPRDCSYLNTTCTVGKCSETYNLCYGDAVPNGTSCSPPTGAKCCLGTCYTNPPSWCH